MADAEPARCARETSVSDQSDLVAHALPVKGRGGGEHFAHAWTALRSLIADDENVAFLVVLLRDGLEALLFGVEHARGAAKTLLFNRHAGDLHDGAFRRKVALETNDAAGHRDGLVCRIDNVLQVVPLHRCEVLGNRAAGDRKAVAMQEAMIQQRLHHQRNAADFEHILGDIFAAGLQVRDVRRALEDFGHVKEVELDAALMRDSWQMQSGVG